MCSAGTSAGEESMWSSSKLPWERNGRNAGASNSLAGRALKLVAGCLAHRAFHRLAPVATREEDVTSTKKRLAQMALGAGLFVAGIAAGSLHARSVGGQ